MEVNVNGEHDLRSHVSSLVHMKYIPSGVIHGAMLEMCGEGEVYAKTFPLFSSVAVVYCEPNSSHFVYAKLVYIARKMCLM